jgi:hypothetical protein
VTNEFHVMWPTTPAKQTRSGRSGMPSPTSILESSQTTPCR